MILAEVRRSLLEKFDPAWVEEALAAAAAVPPNDDIDVYMTTVCAAASAVLKARLARTRASNKKISATNAAVAACMAIPDRGIKH